VTALQISLLLGAVLGGGVALAVYQLVPYQPDLADVAHRLTPPPRPPGAADTAAVPPVAPDVQERLGIWAERHLPTRLLGIVPAADLAVLRVTRARYYGKKLTYAGLGLTLPSLLGGFFTLLGIRLPLLVPAAATIALAAVLFLAPSRDITAQARKARADIARALTAYIELCALERGSGSGAAAALTTAAGVGDTWIYTRIGQDLARARYNGQPPWDALTQLADDLNLPELADIADIMRLAGDENTQVYQALRARADSLRSALLSAELADASQVEERMYLPASLLGLVFLALLMTPPLLRLFGTT
jgi:hypothetical protein